MSEPGRESELAELLAEVRALREDIARLKPDAERRAGYAVLAVTDTLPDVDYNVLVSPRLRDPSYAVLVRTQLPRVEDPPAQGS